MLLGNFVNNFVYDMHDI